MRHCISIQYNTVYPPNLLNLNDNVDVNGSVNGIDNVKHNKNTNRNKNVNVNHSCYCLRIVMRIVLVCSCICIKGIEGGKGGSACIRITA